MRRINIIAGILLTFSALLSQCGATNPGGPLDPLPYPQYNPTGVPERFFFADSQVVMVATLSFIPTGADAQGRLTVDTNIQVEVTNSSNQDYQIEGDRMTVYGALTEYPLATVGLDPLGTTQQRQTIQAGTSAILHYGNMAIDGEITVPSTENQAFVQVGLLLGENEIIVTSQMASVSG